MATKAAERLLPLLSRFAEKKLEHPKDSLKISVDHFEMVKSRSNKKFEHEDLPDYNWVDDLKVVGGGDHLVDNLINKLKPQ